MSRTLIFLLLALTPLSVNGQDGGKRPAEVQPHYPFFTDAEVRLILDFYRPGSGNLPPGLAKRGGELPPGSEKQLRRAGTLPAALEKKAELLPDELAHHLLQVPAGYRRVVCGTAVLLVQDNTKLIVDAVELVKR